MNGKPTSKSTGVVREPDESVTEQTNRDRAQAIADYFEARAKAGLPIVFPPMSPPVAIVPSVPSFHDYSRELVTKIPGDLKYQAKLTLYLDHVDQFLGPKACRDIGRLYRPDFIGLSSFLLSLGYSETTVTAHLKLVRQVFGLAVTEGFAIAPPVTPMDYLVNPMPAGPAEMNLKGIELLVNSTSAVDWRSAVLSGFYLGMELLDSANQRWDTIDFGRRVVTWDCFTRAGVTIHMSLPMHAVLEQHYLRLKRIAVGEYVCPTLAGKSEDALRRRFDSLIAEAHLPADAVVGSSAPQNGTVQFRSLRLAFAHALGHPGLFRLARFLRSLPEADLRGRIASLPNLQLKSLTLLGI